MRGDEGGAIRADTAAMVHSCVLAGETLFPSASADPPLEDTSCKELLKLY